MLGPSEPGRGDRVYAEFQAQMLAREAQAGDSQPEEPTSPPRIPRFIGTWVLLLVGGALVAIVFPFRFVYVAVVIALLLAVIVQIVMAIRRRSGPDG